MRSMIPKFSLRMLLVMTTIAALVALVGSLAIRGQDWAVAVSVMFASIFVVGAVHVLLFFIASSVAYLAATIFGVTTTASTTSPTHDWPASEDDIGSADSPSTRDSTSASTNQGAE